MTTVIQNWVCNKTGLSLNLEHNSVGKSLCDGFIYYKLIEFITPGKDRIVQLNFPVRSQLEALSNLELLCPWLKILGVNHSPSFLKEISQCNNEACLRMLYEIYLRIEDRNHIYLVTKQREAYLLSKKEGRFHVKKAPESQIGFDDSKFPHTHLEDPLVNNKPLILKYKYRKEKLLKKCKQESARRARKLALMDNPKLGPNFEMKINVLPQTSIPSRGMCIKKFETKTNVNQSEEKMYLFQKKKHTLNIEKTNLKMFASVLQDLWSTFLDMERNDFENVVRAKLLEQSSQEKELSIKWLNLHTQYKNFLQQSYVTQDQAELHEPIEANTQPYNKVDEKKRLMELHSRLFEKVTLKIEKRKLNLCSQIVIDLVDYSMLKSEYWRAHKNDLPRYVEFLWKELFYKGLPIEFEINNHFNIKSGHKSIVDIKLNNLQTKITDVLLDAIVDCYLKQEGLWSAPTRPRSLNEFGFIIHTFLQFKYPLPPDIKSVKLPDFTIKVILANLHDQFVLQQLKELLEVRSVVLIDVNLFTNYCLEKFEQERSYYDLVPNDDFVEKISGIIEIEGVNSRNNNVKNKETQFPVAADSSTKHSYAGLLGKLAFEMLNAGESLDDVLLAAMLVEYLKTLEDKRGFVLVGYPSSQYQILLFEYFVMGKPLKTNIKESYKQRPVNSSILLYLDNLIRRYVGGNDGLNKQYEDRVSSSQEDYWKESANDEEIRITVNPEEHGTERVNTLDSENVIDLDPHELESYDDLERLRKSKILPNPTAEGHNKHGISQTYIERYITICKGDSYIKSPSNIGKEDKTTSDYKKCLTLSQKTNFLKRNNITGEHIYEQFDKFTKMYIWDLDAETLAFISKIILDLDVELPAKEIKQSIVSFGRLITKAKESDAFFKPKSKITSHEDIQYIPSPAYYDCKTLLEQSRCGQSMEGNIFPCANGSNYSLLPSENQIPEKLQVALASIWEQVEISYLKNLRESLYKILFIKSQWVAFKNYVNQLWEQCIQNEDERLRMVNNFQIMFNAVDIFARKVPIVKAELHVRVKELWDALLNLIINKKSKAIKVKNDLEETQWVKNHTSLLTNSYLQLMQHEIDRTVDSLQIVCDYYKCLLGEIPDTKTFTKIDIKPLPVDEYNTPGKKKLKVVPSQGTLPKKSISNETSSDMNVIMSSGLSLIRGKIKSLQSFFDGVINAEKNQTNYADKKTYQSRDEVPTNNKKQLAQTSSSLTKMKNTKSRSKSVSVTKVLKSNEYEPSRKENSSSSIAKSLKHENVVSEEQMLDAKIKAEWENVVQIELGRITDVIALIEEIAKADIDSTNQAVNFLYEKFGMDIEECFKKEIQALKNIKNIFSAAIEDEVPIQPLLVFDNDNFFIDKSNLLFPDNPPDPPVSVEEKADKYKFKISQLEKLVAKLQKISPNSIMIETLESVLYTHFQSNEVPDHWKTLSENQLHELLSFVYGRVEVVDWKVFIIFATDIPFPTVADLLDLKRHFEQIDQQKYEIISKEQFYNTTLWFDKELSADLYGDLRLILSKQLIQKVFEVNNSELNYKEFLLFFCKSENNKEGLMKILELLNDKGSLKKNDCAVHDIVPIDAIIVAKQEFDRILSSAFNIIDGITVKTLPTDSYKNIFSSPHNEYIETEIILVNNCLASSRHKSSGESEPQLSKHVPFFEEYKNYLPLYERFPEPIWYKCVPYKLAVMILMFALNLHFPSLDSFERQRYIETRLKDLYKEKGVNNYIQAFHLYESKFMQEIFEISFFFKTCRLDVLLKKYTENKISQ